MESNETNPTVESNLESTLVDDGGNVSGVKRKRSEYENNAQSLEPASVSGAVETPVGDGQSVEVLAHNLVLDNPRLTISRHPTFTTIPNTGDPPLCTTELCLVNRPLNQIGYRYYPAGLSDVGSTIAYRTIESRPTSVRVSWEDRSPFIRVSEDGLELGGQGGFRSVRANVPIREGKWYMEVNILKVGEEDTGQRAMRDGAHVRLGWSRREAPLNGPVGLDGYSYGFRDKSGEKVTLSRPKPYGKPFGSGDVIGLYISLPSKRTANPDDPDDPARKERHRIAIKYRGQEYWETLEIPQSKEMIALTLPKQKSTRNEEGDSSQIPVKKSAAVKNAPGSQRKPPLKQEPKLRKLETLGHESVISFFVNGECQGIAFSDLYDYLQLRKETKDGDKTKKKENVPGQHQENPFDDGTLGYYPTFSLYGDARIRLNPGPDFKFPPPDDIDCVLGGNKFSGTGTGGRWRPICERYPEFMQEMWAQDALDEARAKVAVAEAAEREKEEAAKQVLKEKKREAAARRKKTKEGKLLAQTSNEISKEKSELPLDNHFGPSVDDFFANSVDFPSYAESVDSNDNDHQEHGSPSESAVITGPSTPASYEEGEEEDEQEIDVVSFPAVEYDQSNSGLNNHDHPMEGTIV